MALWSLYAKDLHVCECIYVMCWYVNALNCLLTLCAWATQSTCKKRKKKRIKMVYDYNTHYKLRPIVAPWQLNRVWAGLHCLLSTRITQLRWMASYTRTHSCMWGCLGCGVRTGLCTQSLISVYDRLHTCTLAHTQTHTHTHSTSHRLQEYPPVFPWRSGITLYTLSGWPILLRAKFWHVGKQKEEIL